MTRTATQTEVLAFRPPTPAEVDQFATISAISFILGMLAFLCVVGTALAVALKTNLPGRWAVFFSFVLLSSWWALEQFMGGNLEIVFGPVALLVSYTVYSAFALVFALGYLRMSFAVFKKPATKAANNMV